MRKISQLFIKAAAVIGFVAAAPLAAEPILLNSSSVGESYSITFDGFVDGGPALAGLGGELTLSLTSVIGGVYMFDYAMRNTAVTTDSVSSRIAGFAFNTDPDIDAATSTGTYAFTNTNSNFSNGIGRVDVCFQGARTGSCAGGGSGGVFDGVTGAGTLALAFGTAPAQLTLDDFFVRYQSISGLGHVTSASGRQTSSSSSGGTDVPAPGMLAIFGLALLALVGIKRRRPIFAKRNSTEVAFA